MARLGNTPVQRTNIYLDRGKSYALDLVFETKDYEPFDLTGFTVRIVVASPPHFGGEDIILMTAVHLDSVAGVVQFPLQAAQLLLEPGEYPYDITLLGVNGYSSPVVKGYFLIGFNTDSDVSNTYPGANQSQAIRVTMEGRNVIHVCLEYADGIKGDQGDQGIPGIPTGVFIQPEPPLEGEVPPYYPLWVDTDAEDPPLDGYLPIIGGVMAGGIDMDGHPLKDVPDPVDPQDPVTLAFLEDFLSTPGHGADEIWVGPSAPATNNYELWYDTTSTVLKVKISGSWSPITAGEGGGSDEVWVGPDTPPANQELWIDTNEPDPGGGTGIVMSGYYRHDQATPALSWVVNHSLGYRPAVHVQDSAGNVLYGSVTHLSDATLVITFTTALTGSAHCS